MIRYSLAACLRLYGCERSSIRDAGIIADTEVQHLPARCVITGIVKRYSLTNKFQTKAVSPRI